MQRLAFADRPVSYTVVGTDQLPVTPAREYLVFLTQEGASPNTVRTYAYGLAAWWTVLEHTDTAWDDFPTSLFGQFLHYLRTGDLPNTPRIGAPSTWLAPASLQPRAAAVLSMYRYFSDAHDLIGPYRRLFSRHGRSGRRRGGYKPFLTGVGPQREPDHPVYRQRTPNRTETPVLLPGQVSAILDACSVQTDAGWSGSPACLRDRLFFAVLAETGMRMGEALSLRHNDFHITGGDTPWVMVAGRDDHPVTSVRAKSGARRIYIGDDLVALYSEYVWSLIGQGADVTVPGLATHFVFVNLARGQRYTPIRPESIYTRVRAIRRDHPSVPVDWTPHWLRHTHATALLLAGVGEHVVMRRLGHADVQTTLSRYGWVTEDAEMRSVAEWKNYVAGWKGLHG